MSRQESMFGLEREKGSRTPTWSGGTPHTIAFDICHRIYPLDNENQRGVFDPREIGQEYKPTLSDNGDLNSSKG